MYFLHYTKYMLMEQKLSEMMSEQMKNELESAYKYLGMAAYFEGTPYHGMAHWMQLQAKEEVEHAMKFFEYIKTRGNGISLGAIQQMNTQYHSPLAAFQEALKHEQLVTRLINDLYTLAVEQKDYASQVFLQWFITEQTEEEEQVQEIIDQLISVADSSAGLFAIDAKLAKRAE